MHSPLSLLLLQLLVIILTTKLAGALFKKIGQPAVVGEMAAGIALGPSILGAVLPGAAAFVFPPGEGALTGLQVLGQAGIVMFMFVVGMDLDTKLLRQRVRAALFVSNVSIVVPFLLGSTAAIGLFKGYAGEQSTFLIFALFLGISISITAFPVLARILRELGLSCTPVGIVAITCAALGDVTAWTLLAFIVALSKTGSVARVGLTPLLVAAFIALMLAGVRPVLRRMTSAAGNNPGGAASLMAVITLVLSALFTQAIGIHALFGAFFAGVVMPHNEQFRSFLKVRFEHVTGFLVPVFFALTGVRTQIGLLHGPEDWLVCLFVFAIAVAGKFGGSAIAARMTGMSWKDSAAVGALMNTRGLMELIVLNLGLDLGILSPKIFTMLVLMAMITTFCTGPFLRALRFGSLASRPAGDLQAGAPTCVE